MTSLNGEQKMMLSSTNSGVASNFVRAITAGARRSRSPVRNSQARTRLPTLAGVIWASGENRMPPGSPPQCSQPSAGVTASMAMNSARNLRMADFNSIARQQPEPPISILFRFLGRLRRARDTPRVIFFLRLRNPLQRSLVGFLVHDLLFRIGLLFVAPVPLVAELGVRWNRDQRQHDSRSRDGLHR